MPVYCDLKAMTETLLFEEPAASAVIRGNEEHPDIYGTALLYSFCGGTLLAVQAAGLPVDFPACTRAFFGFHIHEGTSCSGNSEDPFADTGTHWNPGGCAHPNHAGDLPPLLGNLGTVLSVVYTDAFRPEEVLGRTLVIHSSPDDFTSQPSGNSGKKIACGKIVR